MSGKLIDGFATIKHINIRKEGPANDKVLAFDIKLGGCTCSLGTLRRLLGGSNDEEVRLAFWNPQGEKRFAGLEILSSWAELDGCHVRISKLKLDGATIKKFKITLNGIKDNQLSSVAALDFLLSVRNPPEHATTTLAELVTDEVNIVIEKAQGELPLTPVADTIPGLDESKLSGTLDLPSV